MNKRTGSLIRIFFLADFDSLFALLGMHELQGEHTPHRLIPAAHV